MREEVYKKHKRIKEVCEEYKGKYDDKRGICYLDSNSYKKFREDHKIDFYIESDKEGFSVISQRNGKYYLENWFRPKKPVYGIAGLMERGREYWELIDYRTISKIERNKLKKEKEEELKW